MELHDLLLFIAIRVTSHDVNLCVQGHLSGAYSNAIVWNYLNLPKYWVSCHFQQTLSTFEHTSWTDDYSRNWTYITPSLKAVNMIINHYSTFLFINLNTQSFTCLNITVEKLYSEEFEGKRTIPSLERIFWTNFSF